MMFKIEIKYHLLLFSLSTTLWTFFLLGGLSTEYFQTWPVLQTLIIVDIIPAILLIPLSYYLLKSVIGHHYIRASLFAAFYASTPLVFYDVIYIAFHLKKGLFFFFDYWYLTIFYFIPWIIIPIVAYTIKKRTNKMKLPLTAFLFIIPMLSFGQKESETTEFMKYEYLVEKQYSEYFKEERTIKIYLPENYNKNRKHPVIYTLDGYELFEITTNYIRFLSKYDVLPNCIVVGIYHNDRNYETKPNYGYNINISTDKFLEGSEKLKNYLFKELISFINLKFHTSGYNVLIGHSNTATFANQIIVEKENPFRGFVAITPDLLDNQIDNLKDCLKNKEQKRMYYFVSSGKKDDKYRLETGMKLDTIFKANTTKSFIGIHKIYNAGHLDLVAKSLNDALMFVFSDYRNFNDFQEKVIENKSTIQLYLQEKFTFTNENYGIKYKLNEDDYLFLIEIISAQKNKELLEQVLEIGEINTFYPDNHLYSDKAQYYESAGFYEEALKNWKLQIENGFNDNVFYYERPFKLIYYKLDEPKEAIEFLEYSIKKYPKGKLIFNYYIAKVCAEKEIMKEKGLKSINYCIKEFNENRKFNLSSAEEIRKLLNK